MNEHQHTLQARTRWRAHRNGRPWSREDDAAIRDVLDGDDDDVCRVALARGRTFTSLKARRNMLRGLRDDLAAMNAARTPAPLRTTTSASTVGPVDR